MSSSTLGQLIELFPNISEEFLSGIYDAYKDEDTSVDDLIDVVFSFEHAPPRVLDEHLETNNGDYNGSAAMQVEVLNSEMTYVENLNLDQPIENEGIQKSVPMPNGLVPSERLELLTENFNIVNTVKPGPKDDSYGEELPNDVPCENKEQNNNCFENNTQNKMDDSDKQIDAVTNSEKEVQIIFPDNEIIDLTKIEMLNEDEDSSPECSIKYLMEDIINDISTQSKDIEKISEEKREPTSSCDELKDGPLLYGTNTLDSLLNSKGAIPKKPPRRRHISCSTLSQHGSVKRATLRSCKVKNEEERLRRKIVNHNRHLRDRPNSAVCPSQFHDFDKKYSLLSNIFTDANPDYLVEQCKLLTNQEKILTFISQNLELKNYPKMETVEEKPELIEEFHCTVTEFLEAIPDPVAEFSSVNYIRSGYEQNAEIYLKARYKEISDEDVKERLRNCRFVLSDVCRQLEREGRIPTPGVLDYTSLHHPASVFFYQEIWYIEHRNEIEEYLDSAIEAARVQEEINRPPPPPVDEVFECSICAEEVVEYTNLGTCDGPSGHLFCVNCIKRSAEVRIGDGETTFPCLVGCGAFIPLPTIEELLPRPMFFKLMGRIQEEEIRKANIAGVETCPFCPFAFGPGEEELFICQNPDCMKLSCRICRKEDHSPDICEMFKNEDEESARLIIENRMTEALMRTCYKCGKNFVKSTGCNKMVCTCGARMCYVCRQPVENYEHFNGDGGTDYNRCPLFSNDEDLHVRPVQTTAQQVFNEIATNNPQLNLDAAKIIPK